MGADLDKGSLITRCNTLSPRAMDVLRRWSHQSAKEIAIDLKISENTVRSYANEARQKLGVGSTRKAARIFLEFEASRWPHQNRGDQFRRVEPPAPFEARSEPGYSDTPDPDLSDGDVGEPGSDVDDGVNPRKAFGPASNDRDPPLGEKVNFAMTNSGDANRGPSLLDRNFSVRIWLGRLGSVQWLCLTVALTIGVIVAFAGSARGGAHD